MGTISDYIDKPLLSGLFLRNRDQIKQIIGWSLIDIRAGEILPYSYPAVRSYTDEVVVEHIQETDTLIITYKQKVQKVPVHQEPGHLNTEWRDLHSKIKEHIMTLVGPLFKQVEYHVSIDHTDSTYRAHKVQI